MAPPGMPLHHARAFQLLAIETNAHIASLLDDRDLAHFASTCSSTRAAVYCDRSPVWRDLFSKHFDLVPGLSNNDLRTKYQERRKILLRGARFARGTTDREKRCLLVIRDLVVESYFSGRVEDASGNVTALNLQQIERFVMNTDLLYNVLLPKYASGVSSLLSTIQILLTHFRLGSLRGNPTWGFPDSQKMVYQPARKVPLFIGKKKPEVNLQWVGAALNYFKYHLTHPNQTLQQFWNVLDGAQKPKAWMKRPESGVSKLGRRWKGVYGFVDEDEIHTIRTSEKEEQIEDSFNEYERDDGPFQTMVLDFSDNLKVSDWPKTFESHLRSLTHPTMRHRPQHKQASSTNLKSARAPQTPKTPQTRSGISSPGSSSNSSTPQRPPGTPNLPSSAQFAGIGKDISRFCARGWINELPEQNGIPGWQRITMMKFFMKEADNEDNIDENDNIEDDVFSMKNRSQTWDLNNVAMQDLWGYEGVVLPGGQIMVGRWWDVDAMDAGAGVGFGPERPANLDGTQCYCGPFMFWCIDGSEENDGVDMMASG